MESFFSLGAQERLGTNNQLLKLNQLVDWNELRQHLKGLHKNEVNSQGGPVSYDALKMFKAILLGQWHSLSDVQLEESLRVRLDFMLFTGFELAETLPDATTLCRFRIKLIQKKLAKKLFKKLNGQLEKLGMKIESAPGAIVDATLIESAARPRRVIEMSEDREESREEVAEEEPPVEIHESVDADARWLKKGKKSYFGYKGFIRTTEEEGFIQEVQVTPANQSETKQLPELVEGLLPGSSLYADKGYPSQKNSEHLKEKHIKNRIMRKASRGHELSHWEKLFNKLISKRRYKVEQAFGTLKRRFTFRRASYLTTEKVLGQLCFKCICFNLLKAVNRVQLA